MKTNSDGTQRVTLDILRDILIREMELKEDRVTIYNQKFQIPTDDGLFAVVGYKGSPRIISNRNTPKATADGFTEVQDITTQETIFITIYSRSTEALRRKEEMLMAINSMYAQARQESDSFKISKMSPIEDLSAIEASANLYRFEISILCFSWSTKTKETPYFNAFTAELSTEKESGIAILP